MNIQQLNDTGKPIRVFIITAVVAVAITGAVWWIIEDVKNFQLLRDELTEGRTSHPRRNNPRHSLAVRIYMFGYIVRLGGLKWMWYTGIGWRLLSNSTAAYCYHLADNDQKFESLPRHEEQLLSYITRLIRTGPGKSFFIRNCRGMRERGLWIT